MKTIEEQLQAPFAPEDVEWRLQRCGKKDGKLWGMALAYLTNRAIQNRLDDVFGVFHWKNRFENGPVGGVLCAISIWDETKNEWIEKCDGADTTKIEEVKGSLSASMKRTAVQLGIGRYLYNLSTTFVDILPSKPHDNHEYYYVNDKNQGVVGYWKAPDLPVWALPMKKIKLITTSEGQKLQRLLQSREVDYEKCYAYFGINHLHELPADQYEPMVEILMQKPMKALEESHPRL